MIATNGTRRTRRWFEPCRWIEALLLIVLLPAQGLAAQHFLFPESPGWKVAQYPGAIATVPPEVLGVDFDDSSWPTSPAAFGIVDGSCVHRVGTVWSAVATTLVARRDLQLPAGLTYLEIDVWFGNGEARGYLNGFQFTGSTHSGGCIGASGSTVVPWTRPAPNPVRVGRNALVIIEQSSGGSRYLDAEAWIDVATVPTLPQSWGAIHALYRHGAGGR